MCAGCGAPSVARTILRALKPEDHAVIAGATGCMEVSTFIYPYTSWTDTPLTATDVPAKVTGYWGAGRLNKGDMHWEFSNSSEDTNYDVISGLKNALQNYKSTLVGWF